jgi:hypothetical protein
MRNPEQQRKVDELRDEFFDIRAEFHAAKEQLSKACKTVPDLGINPGSATASDGALIWQHAVTRYQLAEKNYGEILKRFAAASHDLRLL